FLFQNLGLDPLLAGFIGLAIIGLAAIGAGVVMLLKGINAFKQTSLAPERTIETLQHFKGSRGMEAMAMPRKEKPEEKLSSEELEACVLDTENRIAQTLEK